MLTGKRAFQGSSPASVIAAIMERPAPSIADIAPPVLDRVLKTCLAKDPDERWQTARDLKRELEWIASAPESGSASVISAPSLSRLGKVAVAAAAVLAAALAGVAFVAYRATQPGELKPLMRLDADLGVDVSPGAGEGSVLAIAPNGSRLAFVTRSSDGKDHLALQLLDSGLSTVIPDTEGAAIPFFSPDSRWVTFFAGGKLKKISVEGGQTNNPVQEASNPPRSVIKDEDGNIVFAAENRVPLSRVSSSGGDPKPATELDVKNGEISNRYPQVLPGGEAILFQSRTVPRLKPGSDDLRSVHQDGAAQDARRGQLIRTLSSKRPPSLYAPWRIVRRSHGPQAPGTDGTGIADCRGHARWGQWIRAL